MRSRFRYSPDLRNVPYQEWAVSTAFVAGGDSEQSLEARVLGSRYRQALMDLIDAQKRELIIARREGSYDHHHFLTLEREDELNLERARLERAVIEIEIREGN